MVSVSASSTISTLSGESRIAERAFRPDVQGLRAIAVTLVVLYHAGVRPLQGGYIGVDVFFVLSGFLITGLLIRERVTKNATSIGDFYARRVRRILPAGTLVLVCTILASYHWLGFLRADVIARDGQWTAIFAANLRFALQNTQYSNILAHPSPLQHYWSLAVEEQFYLVWPCLFLIVATIGRTVSLRLKLTVALTVLILASFAWSVAQTRQNGIWAFFSPLTRAWELAIGALLAVAEPMLMRIPHRFGPWMSWAGIAAIIVGGLVFNDSTAFPGAAVALPVLATACAVAGGTVRPGGGAEIILGLPPFQWLGDLSYSLYLWHWPLLTLAAQQAGKRLPPLVNVGWVALALLFTFITYHTIENPVRHAKVLRQHRGYSMAIGLLLVLVSFGLCTWELYIH